MSRYLFSELDLVAAISGPKQDHKTSSDMITNIQIIRGLDLSEKCIL